MGLRKPAAVSVACSAVLAPPLRFHRSKRRVTPKLALVLSVVCGCVSEGAYDDGGSEAAQAKPASGDVRAEDSGSDMAEPSGTDASTQEKCWQLRVQDCESHDGCTAILGHYVDQHQGCWLTKEKPIGCREASLSCFDASAYRTYAVDSDGAVWQVSGSCIPEGWDVPSESPSVNPMLCPSQAVDLECAALNLTDCRANPECMLVGASPFNPEMGCIERTLELVGCRQNRMCSEAITYGRDLEGRIWGMLGCHPLGWTPASIFEPITYCPVDDGGL